METDEFPPMPIRRCRHDDPEALRVSFFRTQVAGGLSSMTLPRSFFGKSEVSDVSFRGTDLSQSTLC
jgi:BTB/POZ domain-containing protein KCTD9